MRSLRRVNSTATVLFIEILNPFKSHHCTSLFRLSCILWTIELKFLPEVKRQLSSANSVASVLVMLAGKSFIITRNNMGEIIDPCGVPFSIVCVPDNVFPTLVHLHRATG